jgi:hypothetical protein
MPKQVNGFSKDTDRADEIIYSHNDDTLVTAEENADGTWAVAAFPARGGSVELARALGGRDAALKTMVAYMKRYTPDGSSDRRAASPLSDGDVRGNTSAGVVGEMGRESEPGSLLDALSDDRDRRSSLFGMGGGDDNDDTAAFASLGDDRDRRSSLFDMSDSGGNETAAFDRLADDNDGSSGLLAPRDDNKGGGL